MSKGIQKVVIIGGGTAGWLAAAYMSQELGTYRSDGVAITLIESSDIPTVGVGEGTFPTLRNTLSTAGISELDLVRDAEATFKQAIRFDNWMKPVDGDTHRYYHLFDPPRPINNTIDVTPYWLLADPQTRSTYAQAVSAQYNVCENALAPKTINEPEYQGLLHYAYHLDAGKFAELLKTRAKYARVEHIIGTVKSIEQHESGDIKSILLEDGTSHTGDLFIDCTGFSAILIGKTFGSKRTTVQDTLFVDTALAVQVPYDTPDAPIPSATISTAHDNGWLWDIGLHTRRGVGCVYSSQHTNEDAAAHTLSEYTGIAAQDLTYRKLAMQTGFRKKAWVNNCVAIGLSGGFLEPLEATGISLTEASIKVLCDYFPRTGNISIAREKFNHTMTSLFEDAVGFIKMHYCLTNREDTDFWKDNQDPSTIPDIIREYLNLWEHNYPRPTDFQNWLKTFGTESFQYVLLGMNRYPDLKAHTSAFPFHKNADEHFEMIKAAYDRVAPKLPTHRELINQILAQT